MVDRSWVYRWVQNSGPDLTARRDARAAKAFLNKATERMRLHRPNNICTDKAPTYRRIICEINHRYDPPFNRIQHIGKKRRNTLIESNHAALKRLLDDRHSFQSPRSAKATLSGIEAIKTIKPGRIHSKQAGVCGEIQFISLLIAIA